MLNYKMKKLRLVLFGTMLTAAVTVVFFTSLVLYKEISYIPPMKEVNTKINLFTPLLDHYYVDFSKIKYLKKDKYLFDKNNIPIYEVNGKYYYHPVYVSEFALGAYEYYLNTRDTSARNIFINCANSLKDNLNEHGSFFYWEYNFEIDYPGGIYGVPWFSAIAQGEGASVLLRAFCETKEKMYLEAAKKAITSIFYDVSTGGVSVVRGNDYIFPQEYPTNPPSDILNGAIHAFFGVYDYYRVTGDPEVKKKCEIILNTFSDVIGEYDTNYWSLYSRWPRYLALPRYNISHITLLKILYLINGEKKFIQYSKKFEDYQYNWMDRTMYVISNHLRQIKEFSFGDLKKVTKFTKQKFKK